MQKKNITRNKKSYSIKRVLIDEKAVCKDGLIFSKNMYGAETSLLFLTTSFFPLFFKLQALFFIHLHPFFSPLHSSEGWPIASWTKAKTAK
jgi:hypothetical protein